MAAEARSRACTSLRDALPSDLPAVLALLERTGLPTAGVAEALPHFVVAEDRGQLVGAVGLEMIDRALEIARARGIEDVFLLTTTAEHYFPRFGFSCVSRDSVNPEVQCSVEFTGACPASAVVMRKSLRGEPGGE
jgi:amino-acid N-acetyltransferase